MSYTPEPDESDGSRKPKQRPTNGRIAIWVGVAAVGLYFLGSGIYGIITGGH